MRFSKAAAVIFAAFFFVSAQEKQEKFFLLGAMNESGSIVNTTFFNAGAALPSNAGGLSLNPAIPAAFHYFSKNKMSVFGSYCNNSQISQGDFYRTGGGSSISLGEGNYIAAEYSFKKESPEYFDNKINRATLAYGALFDESDDDALFIGFNVSYYNFKGKTFNLDDNSCETTILNEIEVKNNLVSADLGFYQSGDGEGLSWGVVFENIFGYSWNKFDKEISRGFLIKKDNYKYKSFLLATNLSVPLSDQKLLLLVPLDVRFWGFMNKKLREDTDLKYRSEVHGGFELQFDSKICGRFGWAWIPEKYTTDESGQLNYSNWDNRFSGGLGINLGLLSFDAFFAPKAWGAGFSLQL